MNCPACKIENENTIKNCKNCEYPFNGTEKEKGIHIGRFINKKGIVNDSDESIMKSQKILIGVGIFNLVFLLIGFSNGGIDVFGIIFNGIITGIILLCGIFIKKKPVTLTLIPLILIIGINILNFIFDPNSILNGILMKIVIIGSLGYSLYLVSQMKKFKKKYE